MTENEISRIILDCAFKIHTNLGPGLLENTYRTCLEKGLAVQEEKALPLIYEEIKLECGYRVDILVDSKVIVELKTVEEFQNVHIAQTLNYMKLSGCHLGLLINFYQKSLKNGIKRLIL